MKLYVGSRNYRPFGYTTVDIDPQHSPDILADITNMSSVEDSTCSEVCASHVLEHLSWPDSFKALIEFTRVLKTDGILRVAVPDVLSLLRRIEECDGEFWAMGLLYGVGGRENDLEIHRYGFTQKMLFEILTFLGYSKFEWWNSTHGDGSNGWIPLTEARRAGISLNIQCTKSKEPSVTPIKVFDVLSKNPMISISQAISLAFLDDTAKPKQNNANNANEYVNIYQDIHYKLIEANQRILYLESMLKTQQ